MYSLKYSTCIDLNTEHVASCEHGFVCEIRAVGAVEHPLTSFFYIIWKSTRVSHLPLKKKRKETLVRSSHALTRFWRVMLREVLRLLKYYVSFKIIINFEIITIKFWFNNNFKTYVIKKNTYIITLS
jgi:hypothetical protein